MAETYRKLTLSESIIRDAVDRADQLPIYDYSHRDYQANIVGSIGEVVFELFLNHYNIDYRDAREQTDLDYVIGSKISVDVKTKDRTVPPQLHYDNSVPLYNHDHQRPDYYFFVSLYRDKSYDDNDVNRFKDAYLVGAIDIENLEKKGKKWEAGQTDPANGTKFWTSCINIEMQKLISCSDILKTFSNK